MSKPFKFKEFIVHQDKCAMKVGTDGVLLGAWANLKPDPNSILDIGTGTGLISLQMAQRSQATIIDAIEIDPAAFEQAVDNFENSPWPDRLFCYHASLDEFSQEPDQKYDMLISNPPFYTAEHFSKDKARSLARSNKSLSFSSLLKAATKLLRPAGTLSVIIPYHEEKEFLRLAAHLAFSPKRICRVKGNGNSPLKRSLLELVLLDKTASSNLDKPLISELILEISRHKYTEEYLSLVNDFYLNH